MSLPAAVIVIVEGEAVVAELLFGGVVGTLLENTIGGGSVDDKH